MKSLFLVAHREVLANHRVFWIAALTGLLPLWLPLSPGLGNWAPSEVGTVGALLCVMMEVLILSIAFGWSMIGRDLVEQRLSFYFSRPISSSAIWAGKFLGTVVVIAGAALTTLLPAAILWTKDLRTLLAWRPAIWYLAPMPLWVPLTLLAGTCLFLLAFSHALGIVLRARSAWVAIHFPLTLVAVLLVMTSVHRLAGNFAYPALAASLLVLACVVLIALWAALGAQMSAGRTDLNRGHHALSLVLWPVLLVAFSGLDVYSRWVDSVDASSLDGVEAVGEVNEGTWIPLCGTSRNRMYTPCFLFDTATGKSLKTGALDRQFHGDMAVISANGRRAIWVDGNEKSGTRTLFLANLEEAGVVPVPVPIPKKVPVRLILSNDGSRAAILQPNLVNIYALPGAEYLGGTALGTPGEFAERVKFLSRDLLRIYLMHYIADIKAMTLEVFDFDTIELKLSPVAAFAPITSAWLPPDPSCTKLVVWKRGTGTGYPALCDLADPTDERALMPEGMGGSGGARSFDLRFLTDGRIVILTGKNSHQQLHFFSTSGEAEGTMDLPGSTGRLVGEYTPDSLLFEAYLDDKHHWLQGQLYFVDYESREIRRIAKELHSASLMPHPGGSLASHLLIQEIICSPLYVAPYSAPRVYFSLVEFNPLTGAKRNLIGPEAFSRTDPH